MRMTEPPTSAAGKRHFSKGALQIMTPIREKRAAKAALCCLLLAVGIAVGGWLCWVGVPAWSSAAARAGEPTKNKCEVPSARDGILLVIGTEIKEGAKVPANQIITVAIDGEA